MSSTEPVVSSVAEIPTITTAIETPKIYMSPAKILTLKLMLLNVTTMIKILIFNLKTVQDIGLDIIQIII